jgi:hypothetical protein
MAQLHGVIGEKCNFSVYLQTEVDPVKGDVLTFNYQPVIGAIGQVDQRTGSQRKVTVCMIIVAFSLENVEKTVVFSTLGLKFPVNGLLIENVDPGKEKVPVF